MFSSGQRVGMFFPIMGACLSLVSVSLVFLLVVFRWFRRTKRSPDACDSSIFLNMMLANLIQALGELPTIKWLADGFITEGPLCTVQAAMKQVGGDGVALSSLAIAVYTFCVLVLRRSIPRYISKLVVLIIWIFIILIVVIPYVTHMKEQFYGKAKYWCWIRAEFRMERLTTVYICLWVSLFLVVTLYTIMFIVMRGWFIVDNGIWYYKNYVPTYAAGQLVKETQQEKDSKAIANLLLLYPAVYLTYMIPTLTVRSVGSLSVEIHYRIILFAYTLFSLSGMFNTALFFLTRPYLIIGPAPATDIQIQSVKSLSSETFGSLPTRSPNACNCVPPAGTTTNTRASSRQVESKLGSHATYTPGERRYGGFRSVPDLAPVEEETYGRLPC